ncbi:MAG TPA: PspC domain-containing protein [Pseudonocardiaceae bacterium]|jgi:signal transduction histidine kinase/phage shock protein PspC (stress-responsive transcriptional regulator)|nr:PspC domain-containing protein [Pseudonocardiaceae bacterium]
MASVSTSAEQEAGIPPVGQPVRGKPPAPDRAPEATALSPLRRHRSGRVIAGVSSGIAEHLGVPVLWVRVIFAVLAGLGGAGLVGYALLWAFVPATDGGAARPSTQRDQQQGVGLVALGAGLALAGAALGTAWGGWVTGPLGVALVGAGVVWREADASQRTRWRSGAGVVSGLLFGGGRMALLRVLAGIALVTSGIAVFLFNQGNLGQLRFALLAAAATLVGVAVLTVPWWLRLMRALREERRARIRTEERAEIAAHLHDSVLQTLALIQQQSDSAREVRRLARGQERELRSWLYGPRGYGRARQDGAEGDTAVAAFAAALHAAAGEVEDTYAVSVQIVVVGDCVLEEPLTALVQASREAMVNAAKHAGVAEVSVYAEVEPGQVHVFIRDRGAGFDPAAVAGDRHGLANSIRGRMERHGGTVTLRTAPGEGTEIQLAIARRTGGEET